MDRPVEGLQEAIVELLPRLRRYARTLARNAHDADDLVQAAIERALMRSGQLRAEADVAPWMFGIVRNAWIDETRARGRRGRMLAPEELGQEVGDRSSELEIEMLSVQEAVSRLPEEQRSAVALVLIEGLSYKEAAQVLDVPMGTLTSRLARARATLQDLLGANRGAVP